MGRSITPTYRVEYTGALLALGKVTADAVSRVDGKRVHVQGWRGRATEALLADWRVTMNRSFQAGGSNEHISKAYNVQEHINFARIVHQGTGRVVAEVTMPTFEVA